MTQPMIFFRWHSADASSPSWRANTRLTCPDCKARHGHIKSMTDWIKEGLPKSLAVRCGPYCNCFLEAVELMDGKWELVDPTPFWSQIIAQAKKDWHKWKKQLPNKKEQ